MCQWRVCRLVLRVKLDDLVNLLYNADMISSLKGVLNKIRNRDVEVEVNGVGYLVRVGSGFLRRHVEGEEVRIETYMAVSENDMSLYGFDSGEEVELFKMFLGVSGIGPKTASLILGECEVEAVMKAIGEADVKYFEKIKGVGKKAAQRIIIDLKSKIGGLGELDLRQDEDGGDELYLSLRQLGFARVEIEAVVKKMPMEVLTIEERLSWCLNNLG